MQQATAWQTPRHKLDVQSGQAWSASLASRLAAIAYGLTYDGMCEITE